MTCSCSRIDLPVNMQVQDDSFLIEPIFSEVGNIGEAVFAKDGYKTVNQWDILQEWIRINRLYPSRPAVKYTLAGGGATQSSSVLVYQ